MEGFNNLTYDKTIKSKYKYIYASRCNKSGNIVWFAAKKKTKTTSASGKFFEDEREAALWVDKQLLSMGLEPVNILKRK